MELAAEEPRVVFQFNDLDELAVGREAGHAKAALLQLRHVFGVHLVAMAVALVDLLHSIRLPRDRTFLQRARILAEAHRAAERVDADQVAQLVDDFVRRLIIELGRIRADHPHHVARELDRRALHAEADAEKRDALFARVTDRAQLAFDAARAESRSDQNPVYAPQLAVVPLGLQLLGVDVDDAHLYIVRDAAVCQRFVQRFIRVAELDVLADEADLHLVLGMPQLADDLFPL